MREIAAELQRRGNLGTAHVYNLARLLKEYMG